MSDSEGSRNNITAALAPSDVNGNTVIVNANIHAATVKLPDFWQHNPRAWFQHIEAQFQLRGIIQDVTKYFHVVAALDASTTASERIHLEWEITILGNKSIKKQ